MKFLTYNPEQAYLLPPSVREVLGEDQICFFVHQAGISILSFPFTRKPMLRTLSCQPQTALASLRW